VLTRCSIQRANRAWRRTRTGKACRGHTFDKRVSPWHVDPATRRPSDRARPHVLQDPLNIIASGGATKTQKTPKPRRKRPRLLPGFSHRLEPHDCVSSSSPRLPPPHKLSKHIEMSAANSPTKSSSLFQGVARMRAASQAAAEQQNSRDEELLRVVAGKVSPDKFCFPQTLCLSS
jgi:hypothetical protein